MPVHNNMSVRFRNLSLERGAGQYLFVGNSSGTLMHMYEWTSVGFGSKITASVGSIGSVNDIQYDSTSGRVFFTSGGRLTTTGAQTTGMATISTGGLGGLATVSSGSSLGSSHQIRYDAANSRLVGSGNASAVGGRLFSITPTAISYVLLTIPSPDANTALALDVDNGRIALAGPNKTPAHTIELRPYSPTAIGDKFAVTSMTYNWPRIDSMAFSNDKTKLLCGIDFSPSGIIIMDVSGSGGMTSPTATSGTLVISPVGDIKLNPTGTHGAASIFNVLPRFRVFSYDGATAMVLLASPTITPTGSATKVAWSFDGSQVAVAHATAPFVTVYSLVGTSLVKIANPITNPGGNALAVCFAN